MNGFVTCFWEFAVMTDAEDSLFQMSFKDGLVFHDLSKYKIKTKIKLQVVIMMWLYWIFGKCN